MSRERPAPPGVTLALTNCILLQVMGLALRPAVFGRYKTNDPLENTTRWADMWDDTTLAMV